MIKVTVYRTNNLISGFELTGHADSGPYGYDLVCAGVSAVTFGSVNAVMELCESDLEIEQGDEGGYLRVIIPNHTNKNVIEKIQLLFDGMLVSLKSIEQEYGQFITIQSN